jgi:nucleotide-binding universal stress UspA family protein
VLRPCFTPFGRADLLIIGRASRRETTALALGRPFAAHLHFLHVHLAPAAAAVHVPHFEYCQGTAISRTLEGLRQQGTRLSTAAREHFQAFCKAHQVAVCEPALRRPTRAAGRETAAAIEAVTASFAVEGDEPVARLLMHARHCDLVVVGRPHNHDHLPANLIEMLLMGSGRPIVIAPESAPRGVIETVMVAWKESPEAARALAAAMPLLKQAQQILLVTVSEPDAPSPQVLEHLSSQLYWHGIDAEVCIAADSSGSAETLLPRAAEDLKPDLLVVGGFGRGPLRECVFGGVTRSLIAHAPCPVFMVH